MSRGIFAAELLFDCGFGGRRMKKSMFSSVENFRDMGGTPVANGKKIKKGVFFRSGALDKVSEEDKAAINALNIGTVIDYRDKSEIAVAPDFDGNFKYVNVPALKGLEAEIADNEGLAKGTVMLTKEIAEAYKKKFLESYGEMPIGNEAYKVTLSALNEHKPILFHCASGKDRTGVGAMLITLALGGSKEQAMKDYLDSNEYRKEDNQKVFDYMKMQAKAMNTPEETLAIGLDLMQSLMFTQEKFLNASLNAIFSKYNTFDEYLLGEYGITKEMKDDWKAFYLE